MAQHSKLLKKEEKAVVEVRPAENLNQNCHEGGKGH